NPAFDPAMVSEVRHEEGVLLWLDVENPGEPELRVLQEELGLHDLAIEDCLHPHQRPKIEQYTDHFFIVLYGMTAGDEGLVEHETAIFVGSNYLVTIRKPPSLDLGAIIQRWDAHPDLAVHGGGYLLYILLDEVVDAYFVVLDSYEDRTEDLEQAVFESQQQAGVAEKIFALKKDLVRFRRWVAPLRDVLDVLQRRTIDIVKVPLEPYYRDVYDHVLRVTDFIDSVRDILATALEAHLSIVSNRLNVVMKQLTSWGAILLVPTLIAGIYGMNFLHMPELRWRFGYAFALGTMVVASTILYRVFKRRDWL
ncbi:MAG: magnesium/cobalt transporter CorA, partial [Actinobacteria bacterium]|nr:magnesium/cobalt transporter CorA [Actinomycetota bacterium]